MPQNATGPWNMLAPTYRFDATTAQGITLETKFSEAYNGTDFAADFNRILKGIDLVLRPHATTPPGYTGDDLLIGELLSYPD
jgi:hypothetical protein